MKQLKFKYMSAENFLCFGPEGIEIDFSNLGNIVLIRGDNLDVHEEEEKVASNGIGKSSIPEVLVYTLYGKTIKHPKKLTHKDVINNQTKKKLRTEVIWDKYRVERKRKPNSLRIWESKDGEWTDENEITLGTMKDTQNLIEEKIGLSYEGFINLVVFTDNNAGSFLELDTPAKRTVVENLLGLDKYREYLDRAKASRNDAKEKVKMSSISYHASLTNQEQCENRIKQYQQEEENWKIKKNEEVKQLKLRLDSKKNELEISDTGTLMIKYQEAQAKISELSKEVYEYELKQGKVEKIMKEVRERISSNAEDHDRAMQNVRSAERMVRDIEEEISKNERTIVDLNGKKGSQCPTCFGVVKIENFAHVISKCEDTITSLNIRLKKAKNEVVASKSDCEITKQSLNKLKAASEMAIDKLKAVSENLGNARSQIANLSKINKPVAGAEERILEEMIGDLEDQIRIKQKEVEGPSPFVDIVKSTKEELKIKEKDVKAKKEELKRAEEDLPYYEFWVKAFGDSGIRKFVIDGIIPSLNARTAYWMQILIDGKIRLTFNNQLEETIERNPPDGDPFVYWSKSGGERRRLNLATMFSWAYVTMLNSGKSPSSIWLDEVTSNIDQVGVVAVYNMIRELSKDKQVFVTTHDQELLEMLNGCEMLKLQKRNGIAKLV